MCDLSGLRILNCLSQYDTLVLFICVGLVDSVKALIDLCGDAELSFVDLIGIRNDREITVNELNAA